MTDEPPFQSAYETPADVPRDPTPADQAPAGGEDAAPSTSEDALVWPPPRPRPRGAAFRAGAVAAAATGGALVAFGLRDDGNALAPFTGAGRLMLGIAATEGPAASALAFVAGLAAHLALCLLWGLVFALLAARRRPWHLAVTAALLATVVYSATRLWLPGVLQLGYAVRATKPQLVLLHALLGGGLWTGTRLAQLARQDA